VNERAVSSCDLLSENSTPPKMYNANVSCAILRSFVKNSCAKDLEDLCKQKNIQLGIELDALNKALQARSTATPLASSRSMVSGRSGAPGSRPPSGASSSRPITPTLHAGSSDSPAPVDDGIAEVLAKKTAAEAQMEVVAGASKLAKGKYARPGIAAS